MQWPPYTWQHVPVLPISVIRSHMSMSQCLLALLNGRRRAVVRWLYEYSRRVATFFGVDWTISQFARGFW